MPGTCTQTYNKVGTNRDSLGCSSIQKTDLVLEVAFNHWEQLVEKKAKKET